MTYSPLKFLQGLMNEELETAEDPGDRVCARGRRM